MLFFCVTLCQLLYLKNVLLDIFLTGTAFLGPIGGVRTPRLSVFLPKAMLKMTLNCLPPRDPSCMCLHHHKSVCSLPFSFDVSTPHSSSLCIMCAKRACFVTCPYLSEDLSLGRNSISVPFTRAENVSVSRKIHNERKSFTIG